MAAPKPPAWDDIRSLIERVDQVCRESEFLRAQAQRPRQRQPVWPDRRQPPRKHDRPPASDSSRDTTSTPEGSDGTL